MRYVVILVVISFSWLLKSQTVRIDIYSSDMLEMENLAFVNPFRELDNGAFSYFTPFKMVYHIDVDLSSGKTLIRHGFDQEIEYKVSVNETTIILMEPSGLGGIMCSLIPGNEKVAVFWVYTEFNFVRYAVAKDFVVTYPN
jgi:ABC-type transport system involved in multi-copper enzyme maturation permease subunit